MPTRNISLSDDLDTRLRSLSREEAPSVSAFIATALERELARIEGSRAAAVGDDVVSQVSQRDGKLYRFRGRFLDEDDDGAYYAPSEGDWMIVVDAEDGHPERVENADVATWFGENPVPEGVAAEYGLDAAVWL